MKDSAPQSPDFHKILQSVWGYDRFRPLQEEIIRSVTEGRDTLAVLPTGGGKSLCFQLPALALPGICVVVSPLIALMKDQVEQLKKRGIRAEAVYSGMSRRQIDITLDNCVYGPIKFLYVSPERLQTDIFIARLKQMKVNLLAVDEAHCVSQWGYDFRPPYLEISACRELLPGVPCIALTASATPEVKADILDKLTFRNDRQIFQKSFARPNLSYTARLTENKPSELLRILGRVPGSAIIYLRSRKLCEQTARFLQQNRISADFYHAGLNGEQRDQKQNRWIDNRLRIMVATNAFGMGIDKPDVRLVLHLDVPPDPESYYQEAGRAGRDEQKAYAVLLYGKPDLRRAKELFAKSYPPIKTLKIVYQRLANYFKLAAGSLAAESFDFDLNDFARTFSADSFETYHSLRRLEQCGLLRLSENFFSPSTLKFTVGKGALYNFQVANAAADKMIKLLLRMYGGELFTYFVRIKEADVARNLGRPLAETRKMFNYLDSQNIIAYAPQKDKPQLVFLTERLRAEDLPGRLSGLKSLQERDEERLLAICDYVQNDRFCRSRQIAEYFGEKDAPECGVCDNCVEKKRQTPLAENTDLQEQILENVGAEGIDLQILSRKFPAFPPEKIAEIIGQLLETGRLRQDRDGCLFRI